MRYHSITLTVFISCLILLWSSRTGNNTARQDDTPLSIGIAWRGDRTAIRKTTGAADASRFISYEDALCYFRALVN